MKKVLPLGAVALWLIPVTACSSSPASPTGAVAAAEPSPSHAAQLAAPTAAVEFVTSGPIVVEDQVDVAAQRDGVVLEVFAEPGTPVKKGQLLAKLDGRQVTADLEAARAKARSNEDDLKNWQAEAKVLEADYARAEKMSERQIIPK